MTADFVPCGCEACDMARLFGDPDPHAPPRPVTPDLGEAVPCYCDACSVARMLGKPEPHQPTTVPELGGLDDVAKSRRVERWRVALSYATNLSTTARLALYVISTRMETRKVGRRLVLHPARVDVAWLAERIGRSRTTVFRALAEAEAAGWLTRHARVDEHGSPEGLTLWPRTPPEPGVDDDEGERGRGCHG